jgi:hypothetical protein
MNKNELDKNDLMDLIELIRSNNEYNDNEDSDYWNIIKNKLKTMLNEKA